MLTIWLLTTAVGRLAGAASGLADFAASNSDKAAQVQLPPALQQQIDQLKAQATQSADHASVQAQQRAQEASGSSATRRPTNRTNSELAVVCDHQRWGHLSTALQRTLVDSA